MDLPKNTITFEKVTPLPVSQQELFDWHMHPDAFKRLTPPWEKVEISKALDSFEVGNTMELKVMGLISWHAKIVGYTPPSGFVDEQTKGPFSFWQHHHIFEEAPQGCSVMRDIVYYRLPFSLISHVLFQPLFQHKLQKMFDYRHQVLTKQWGHLG